MNIISISHFIPSAFTKMNSERTQCLPNWQRSSTLHPTSIPWRVTQR